MLDVSLRVLYTINTSPQYILAKAPEKVPLHAAGSSSSSPSSTAKHGRASLRTCALAICRSSPELSPDATKDFSVYILDPLEDLMSKDRRGQSGGVAVGMGLLSTILSPYTPDTTMVTGTLVDCGQNEDALEVVVSLRQVAPPVVPAMPDYPQTASSSEKTKSSSKRPTSDQPYLTFNPLPLPSFNERLLSSYGQSQPPTVPKPPREPRKPNPSHATRAHQLPTPYIGPPKRRYRMSERSKEFEKGDISSRESTAELSDISSSQSSEDTSYYGSSEPSSSDTLPSSDAESITSSATIRPYGAAQTPDIGESAVMLAALSSVSSNPTNAGVSSVSQGSVSPSPELVSFLRAYLAYVDAQQGQPALSSNPASCTDPPSAESTTQTTPGSLKSRNSSDRSEDKENQKPRPKPPQQSTKEPKAKPPERCSPLGSARVNVAGTGSQMQNTSTPDSSQSAPASGDHSRKRKLSGAAPALESSQTRRRASGTAHANASTEDLSGIRLNRGWGGLRVRSDGTLWGEKPPVALSEAHQSSSSAKPNERPFVFRSSQQDVPVANARKGPFVVPDWAKGVPPPAPPPRPGHSDEGSGAGNGTRSKKKGKSKSMSRLGGKGSIKRTASSANDACSVNPSTLAVSKPFNVTSTSENPRTSPRTSPGRLPVFAYTSPIGKSRLATLFQAFQTSPLRSFTRKTPPSTPMKSVKRTPSNSAGFSSLFTPTPSNAKTASSVKPRQLFTEDQDEDMPPSPTPTKQNAPGVHKATAISGSPPALGLGPQRRSIEENDEPPSSLPIASSDDVPDSGTLLIPSDSPMLNFGKVHDWSFLNLPPSSPPPASSPSLGPVDGSDLPCSDIPSSDLSEIDSPAVISDVENSSRPSPAEVAGHSIFLTPVEANVESGMNMDEFEHMSFLNSNEPFPSLFNITGEEGTSQIAAFEALQNGLGQEDFSEGWNFLNSFFNHIPTDLRVDGDASVSENRSWSSVVSDQAPEPNHDDTKTDTIDPLAECDDQDSATIAAASLQELLNGCLV